MAVDPRGRRAIAGTAATIACALTIATTGTASAAIGDNRIRL